jgi:hypothetical protein
VLVLHLVARLSDARRTSSGRSEADTTSRLGCDALGGMTASGNQESGQTGLSPQDLRRMFREVLRRWADYENEKPVGWLKEEWEAKTEPAILDRAVGQIWEVAVSETADDSARSVARLAIEPVIARGLVRRAGRFVRPPGIVKPSMLMDWHMWSAVKALYESLGGEVSEVRCHHWGEQFHLIVCESCTAVFCPRRRANQAKRCHLCNHRQAAPPLGSPETVAAIAAGRPIAVCVGERTGTVVTSWKTKTLIRCPECREWAFVRAGATTCGRTACQSRQRRRL